MGDLANFVPRARMSEFRTLTSRSFARGDIAVAHFVRSWSDDVPIDPNPVTDSFMFVVPMIELPAHGGWRDGRRIELPAHAPGSVGYVDFRQCWVADLKQPFETMNFFLPLPSLSELVESFGGKPIDHLTCPCTSQAAVDAHALGLCAGMLSLLKQPHEASGLFADYLFGAMRLHIAVRYGGLKIPERRRGGRLSAWQERRAKEMMLSNLAADISVDEIAAACGLSSRQFERAFSRQTGLPPHRWRLAERVRHARTQMDTTKNSLAEIAQTCGFVDQSHLTRVFAAATGLTPGAYRRLRDN